MQAKDRSGQLTEGLVKWKNTKGTDRRKRVTTRAADTRLVNPYTSYLLRDISEAQIGGIIVKWNLSTSQSCVRLINYIV